jgi:hypothetical protein
MESLIFGIIMGAAALALVTYLTNRSRCLLEQAVQLSGCSESELRELIREGWLIYRRKYVISGPLSFDGSQLADVRAHYPELKRRRAENAATLRKSAEDIAAQMQEDNRRRQEQMAAHQAEMEMLKRIHAEMLRNLSIQLNLIPPDVADALRVLGLQKDASFDEVYQRYRQLAKRSHPDTGGDPQHFMHINAAYDCVKKWLQSHG